VVSSLGHDDLAGLAQHVEADGVELEPDPSSEMTWPPVRIAMSCSMGLAAVAEAGRLDGGRT